VALSHR